MGPRFRGGDGLGDLRRLLADDGKRFDGNYCFGAAGSE
jgi:hypothetical protein